MKVALTGGTGVIGRSAVATLVAAGHDVVCLARSKDSARLIRAAGATPFEGSLFDASDLVGLFEGADAGINLATHIPVGLAAALPGAWRTNDLIRTKGVALIASAARQAGVRRLIQESVSYLYADAGTEWIDEDSPVDITPVTEPVAVAESTVHDFTTTARCGVVLRFGLILGEDPMTRANLKAVRSGRPVGIGQPDGYAHVVHTDDLGGAVAAALTAPSGVYNVGAAPVLRAELIEGYATALGVAPTGFVGPVVRRIAGARLEPLSRSLRVRSDRFAQATGWRPQRPDFEPGWLQLPERAKVAR